MFAVTIDQRGSRRADDGVPELLEVLAPADTVRDFERTVGDEVQALLTSPEAVADVVALVARGQGWWIGVGVGDVDRPVPASVRAARGPALFAARTAVERADRCTAGVAVDAGQGRSPEDALDAETALQTLARLVADRSVEGHEAVDVARRHRTQRAAAQSLGISPQALSARLQVARRDDEERLRSLAVRLLARADELPVPDGDRHRDRASRPRS
jgi:hypothetical protein